MPQQPAFSLATPPLRQRPQWSPRASWQVARVSPLRRLRRGVAQVRLHPWLREGMVGGILGIMGGWVAAYAALWLTAP
ncbi:hypothetical protein [Roseomonas marmotae]|uniref:Uncharacterized protein n=1 Tax=Roseomonas marmotae TaxID=2768161 RepID=A0ABS3KDG0_9PROT|nr:hypothetical protein [Roseomonas marmotae]MBO1074376.1 hypothetical protein [Roseomonas marmotae]QTI78119.1 hypothetical protein IAI58_10360 [Roseomonas marmotae]